MSFTVENSLFRTGLLAWWYQKQMFTWVPTVAYLILGDCKDKESQIIKKTWSLSSLCEALSSSMYTQVKIRGGKQARHLFAYSEKFCLSENIGAQILQLALSVILFLWWFSLNGDSRHGDSSCFYGEQGKGKKKKNPQSRNGEVRFKTLRMLQSSPEENHSFTPYR